MREGEREKIQNNSEKKEERERETDSDANLLCYKMPAQQEKDRIRSAIIRSVPDTSQCFRAANTILTDFHFFLYFFIF